MISITLVTALAVAAAPPVGGPSGQPRKAYSACLQKLIKDRTDAKLNTATFTSEAKSGCAAQEAAFRKSLIDYDVATGLKRADAEEGAGLQVEEYLANAADTYSTYADPK